jgi:hypothetical protein
VQQHEAAISRRRRRSTIFSLAAAERTMSAHFAIPATTFVLKAIIEARLKVAHGAYMP